MKKKKRYVKKKRPLRKGVRKQRKTKMKKPRVLSKRVNKARKIKRRVVRKERVRKVRKYHTLRRKVRELREIKRPFFRKEVGTGPYIETNVDRLYYLVKRDGFVRVAEASKTFKVPRDKIEEWGNILEEHGLIKLHYPSFGEPVLILKKFKPEFKMKKHRKRNRKAVIFNFLIIIVFILFILFQTGRIDLNLLYSEMQNQYLLFILILILIIAALLVLRKVGKRRRK